MLSPSLIAFHDSVYVLSFESATERQENALRQLGEGNFSFVYGIDKQTVSLAEMIENGIYDENAAKTDHRLKDGMTVGEVCCALGHRMVYEEFLRSGGERALIFEDDVVDLGFGDDEIARAVEAIPRNAELILWGWEFGRPRRRFSEFQRLIDHARRAFGNYRYNHRQIRRRYMRPYNDYFWVSAGNYHLHAYTVTRRAAELMLEYNTPIITNADHVSVDLIIDGRLRGYASRTKYFGQRSVDPSDPLESLTRKYY